MSCQQSPASSGGYRYSHDETATARVHPSASHTNVDDGRLPWSLISRVRIESTSTLHSDAPLFHSDGGGSWRVAEGVGANGTPFSKEVLDLLARHPMRRLLIRIGDAPASTSNGMDDVKEEERGPSGTSIVATFVNPSVTRQDPDGSQRLKEHYQDEYASLLRYLLDKNLFPPCGAPLDSLRVRKHGHTTIVHSPPNTGEFAVDQGLVNVESFLAADAAMFCNYGLYSLLLSKEEGWGAATDNGACHSSDDWGVFNSLFASSSGEALSKLLLGTSLDAAPRESGAGEGGRNSVWVDLEVSSSCFASANGSNDEEACSIKATRGASYRVALPTSPTSEDAQSHALNLSLGDVLLGRHALGHALSSKEDERAWYPCPLSDSSRILLQFPTEYAMSLEEGVVAISSDLSRTGKAIAFDMLVGKDGHVDLAAPLAALHHADEKSSDARHLDSPLFGISRTVQRPMGVSSKGSLVTALRYTQLDSSESDGRAVEVQSLDVIPGTLVKPRMRSLRMTLYEGGGAGADGFVPPFNSDGDPFACPPSNASSEECGLVCCRHVGLSELQGHRLTLHPDGTILLDRTVHLQPDSSLWMIVDFDEAYLPFQKFPADANRGVDAFPSRATFSPLGITAHPSTTLYSSSLLILPPVPDMSMPFNVISLSCTLWAFVLGSLLNILVRRGTESVKRELTGEKEKRPLDKLKEKFREKGRMLKEKLRSLKKKAKGRGKEGHDKEISAEEIAFG